MARPNVVIDTNVFIRIAIGDVKTHLEDAQELLSFLRINKNKFDTYIDSTIISEIVFVLTKVYRIEKDRVIEFIDMFFETMPCTVRPVSVASHAVAINTYRQSTIKWGDAMIAGNMKDGDTIVTFDTKHFKKVVHITAMTPKEFLAKHDTEKQSKSSTYKRKFVKAKE